MTSKLVLLLVSLSFNLMDAQLTCSVCNPTTRLACLTTTQYVNCDANGVLDWSVIFNCAVTQFCDYNVPITPCSLSNPICSIPPFLTAATTIAPTTLATTTASTTTAVSTTTAASTTTASTTVVTTTTVNPNTFCKGIKTVGRYPTSTGCKRYIYCYTYMYSGELRGGLYACQGRTLFNPTLQQCVDGFKTCAT